MSFSINNKIKGRQKKIITEKTYDYNYFQIAFKIIAFIISLTLIFKVHNKKNIIKNIDITPIKIIQQMSK